GAECESESRSKVTGRDIIVMGGSAGAVEAISEIVAGLPADLPAAVFVVIHFPAYATSMLPEILARRGALPARHARDGEPIVPGRIYVAPPDHHLLMDRDCVRVVRGPRENSHRPAVDPLFRSAARSHGPRVIGVVVTGTLDDGTAGVAAVRERGGICVVQDPAEAMYPGMPSSAISIAGADHVVSLAEIAPLLAQLAANPVISEETPVPDRMEMEAEISEMDAGALAGDERPGVPSSYSCPECHGVLWEIQEGAVVRFRCRVGHGYSVETLLAEQSDSVEAALWTAMMALKERGALARRMSERLTERGNDRSAQRFEDQAAEADARAETIRRVLEHVHPAVSQGPERATQLETAEQQGIGNRE
ncbi:MAG TPA: chemotaxis protein CheB, partial [Longimicrobium sp.]|nr:chemotaxis protein CheB [Longimicrobium sp.]